MLFVIVCNLEEVGPQNTFKCDAQTVAYITYMCIRYIDNINNEDMVSVIFVLFFKFT